MGNPKYRVVLVSHGEQSKGMLDTVQMLLGSQVNIAAYSLYPQQTVNDLSVMLEKEVTEYGAENIIFMTELMHGSPFNAVVSLTREHDIYHITGMNLAMLMAVLMERDEETATAESMCEAAIGAASESYADVRKLLAASDTDEEEDV
ncbi:MAG: PTS mannose transporter subunit IIA [Clostridia bacterium]|nr:PTS mannose transporter subunit IIA [Clostridia bacterium]